MKRKKAFAITAAVVVVLVASFVHYYNPFAKSIDNLLSLQYSTMRGAKLGEAGVMMTQFNNAQVNKKWSFRWKILENDMRRRGASEAEIKGVITTARNHFARPVEDGLFIYGVPVGVKRVWYHFQPIWVLKFSWGMASDNSKWGFTEGPGHKRILGISGKKPYKLLGMESCK